MFLVLAYIVQIFITFLPFQQIAIVAYMSIEFIFDNSTF